MAPMHKDGTGFKKEAKTSLIKRNSPSRLPSRAQRAAAVSRVQPYVHSAQLGK